MLIAEFLCCDTKSLKNGGQLLFLFRIGRIFVCRPQCLRILVFILEVFQRKFSATWIITLFGIVGFDIAIDLFDKSERSLIGRVNLKPANSSLEGRCVPIFFMGCFRPLYFVRRDNRNVKFIPGVV